MDFVDKAAFKNGRDNLFLEVGGTGSVIRFDSEILDFLSRGLPKRRGPRAPVLPPESSEGKASVPFRGKWNTRSGVPDPSDHVRTNRLWVL